MISTRDALTALIDLVSSNLMQLAALNNDLESYRVSSPNIIDISKDTSILEKLEITVDLRLKIVEILSDARKYIVKAMEEGEHGDLLKKLQTLAEYYIYAGINIDKRVAEKYRNIFIVDNLDYSINSLYDAFTGLLEMLGVKMLK